MRRLGWVLLALLQGSVLPACAHRAQPPLGEVEIVDRSTGERLPIFRHRGEHWVAGVPGHRYALRIANRSNGRILAVVSVDGVNVVSGETAAWHQSGYVFMPWQNYEITGWRKSEARVAAFEFTSLANAYATRTGRPDEVGAIGVALFREFVAQPSPAVSERSDASAARGRAAPSAPEPSREADQLGHGVVERQQPLAKLGTGHGRSETSVVSRTQFERASPQPDQVIVIRYDSRERLIAMGVIAPPAASVRPAPNPFPATAGYVPDPPR